MCVSVCVVFVFVFVLVISLFKIKPRNSTEVPSGVSYCKRTMMHLMKQIISVLDKFHSGVSYNAIGCEFIVNQEHILKYVFKQKHR